MHFLTGLSKKTPERIQLDAGVCFKNLKIPESPTVESIKALLTGIMKGTSSTNGVMLGATRGGGTMKAVPTVRNLEADGMREPIVGSELVDEWDISLTTTLLEITEDTLSLALPMLDWTGTGGARKGTLRRQIQANDYLENVAWAGNTGFGLMLIVFDNALHTGGLNMVVQDKGNGTIPLELRAHTQDYHFEDDYLPVHFYLLEESAAS